MGSATPPPTFPYYDLFSAGVPNEPRVKRLGVSGHTAILQGTDYLITVAKRFVSGQTPNDWHYAKLGSDEIRLLQIKPYTREDDPITCILFKAKRQKVTRGYEALSYSWGDIPKIHHPIWIEDIDSPEEEPYKDVMKSVAELALMENRRRRLLRQDRQRELRKQLIDIEAQLKPLSQQDDAKTSLLERGKKKLELELEKLNRIDQLQVDQIAILDAREDLRKNKELDKDERERAVNALKTRGRNTANELEKLEDEFAKKMGVSAGQDAVPESAKSRLLRRRQNVAKAKPVKTIEEFRVRPNLYTALLHLRRSDKPINLWVDAICINQQKDGEKEKEEQLAVMAEIYGNAQNVCVWMGESNTQLKAALTFVKRITDFAHFDRVLENMNSKPALRSNVPPSRNDGLQQMASNMELPGTVDNLDDGGRTQWYNLMVLLRSKWFSRRWIIQEIGMARNATVHVGSNVIHWDDLCDAINLLNEKADELRNKTKDHDEFGDIEGLSATTLVKVIGNACMKNSYGEVTVKLLTLETLVCSLLAFDSYHAFDAIYSLLSLASDVDEKSDDDPDYTIKPNFKRSTRDLFISFVHRTIKTTGQLDIICRHWAPVIRNEITEELTIPTWVSSMEKSQFGLPSQGHGRQYGENFVGFHSGDTRRRYRACGDRKAEIEIGKNLEPETPQKVARVDSAIQEESEDVLSLDRGANGMHISTGKAGSFSKEVQKSPLPLDKPQGDPFDNLPDHNRRSATTGGTTLPPDRSNGESAGLKSPMASPAPESGTGHSGSPVPANNASPVRLPLDQMAHQAHAKRKPPLPSNNEARMKMGQRTTVDDKKDKLSGILSANGFCIGKITDRSGVMNGGVEGKWVKEKFGWVDAQENDNQVPDVLWRILVADRGPDGGPAPHWYRRACLHVLTDPKITDGSGYMIVSKYTTRRVLGEMTARYLKRVDSVIKKRRLFAAKPAFGIPDRITGELAPIFGLAPESTKDEDLVCILFGCSVPVILRMTSKDKYALIGEAYVHGKMQGEALSEWEKLGGSITTTFNIV